MSRRLAADVVLSMGRNTYNLGRTSRRIVSEIAEVVLPEEGRTTETISRVVEYVDGFVPHMPVLLRKLFPVGLLLIQWGTLVTLFAVRPFSLLGAKARDRYLGNWGNSPFPLFRALTQGVSGLIMSGYYASPKVYRAIGYTPDEHLAECRARRAALMAADGGVDHHTRSMIFEDIGRSR